MTDTMTRTSARDTAPSAAQGMAQAHGVIPTVALVTGASSGIGKELARLLVEDGWTVVIAAEDEAIELAAAELAGDGSRGHVEPVQADLTIPAQVDRLWERATAGGTRDVDLVALNAGVGAGGRRFVDVPLEEDLQVVRLDVLSVVQLAKLAAAAMTRRGRGRLLFTSSVAATMPGPYFATYAASKAFVQSFAQALRGELKDSGVVVTALQPGPTDTNFFRRAQMQATRAGRGRKDDPATVARQGYEAVLRRDDKVVAGGVLNSVQAASTRLMPERLRAAVQSMMTKPRP